MFMLDIVEAVTEYKSNLVDKTSKFRSYSVQFLRKADSWFSDRLWNLLEFCWLIESSEF
jgi:hypothetical protein